MVKRSPVAVVYDLAEDTEIVPEQDLCFATRLEWVLHKLKTDREFVLANSLINCHAFGLDSIVLHRDPDGKLVRLFVAQEGHELWLNDFHFTYEGSGELGDKPYIKAKPKWQLSVAIHPHHCGVKLTAIKGEIGNFEFERSNTDAFQLIEYMYQSPIKDKNGSEPGEGKASFRRLSSGSMFHPHPKFQCSNNLFLSHEREVTLAPRILHTIFVEQREQAAWLVTEMESDPNYRPICYSNRLLESFSFAGLYQPMTPERLDAIEHYLSIPEHFDN